MAKTYDFRDLSDSNRAYELASELANVLLHPELPHLQKFDQMKEEALRIGADPDNPVATALTVIVRGWLRLWLTELRLYSPVIVDVMFDRFRNEVSGSENRSNPLDLHPLGPVIEPGPTFRPGEPKTKYIKRAREYWDRASKGFFDSANASGIPVQPVRPLRREAGNQNKFEWLILHQIDGLSPERIAKQYDKERQSVADSIKRLAAQIGVQLRNRPVGRPTKQN